MSAEVLRRAASLMRERAARVDVAPAITPDGGPEFTWAEQISFLVVDPDATHLTTFGHPSVALAVADWLEDQLDAYLHVRPGNHLSTQRAFAVARAYLGSDS